MTEPERPPIVDWARTGRRLRAAMVVLGTLVVITWLVLGALGDGLRLGLLGELLGLALLVAFVIELVVVGGAAIRGMLAAGERGDRLASDDVTLLPPQLLRRRRRTPGNGTPPAEPDRSTDDG